MKIDYIKIFEKFNPKTNVMFVVGIIGIILILIGNINFKTTHITGEQNNDNNLEYYKRYTEEKLESFLSQIDGVGEVKVIVSIESGEENIYAIQEKISKEENNGNQNSNEQSLYENEYIIIKNSGEENALIEKTLQPVISGVAVACTGADDVSVVTAVTNSVSVVLDVPTHKIYVAKIK